MEDDEQQSADDVELQVMREIFVALSGLDPEGRVRALAWVVEKLGISSKPPALSQTALVDSTPADQQTKLTDPEFGTLAELFAQAEPKTQPEKALVVGYWLQVHRDQPDISSQAINAELKHLGHGVGNITSCLDSLIREKPALVIQIRKNGSSKQARKKYKLTAAGCKKVTEMTNKASE